MSNLEISRAQRLDQRVIELLPHLSRAYDARLVEDGKVKVNGQEIIKPGFKLKPEDTVTVTYEADAETIPEIELPVLYEDDDCVVINKPAGVLAHSKGALNPEATVATWLRGRTKNVSGERAGIVHRLDRATSGVMICAKTPEALSWLQKQFAQRRVKKTYNAVIVGSLNPEAAVVEMPIERNPKKPQTFRVGSNGKSATTTYRTILDGNKYSVVELKPLTGRTHQLRVHLSYLKHPIVGDTLYGGEPADRLYLHALSLELTLPSRTRQIFTAALPPAFEEKITPN
jgi:23S rRNA pseudouridine1911/1915/1917 synthase